MKLSNAETAGREKKKKNSDIVLSEALQFNFELGTRLVATVTDAGVEHFGSMLASVPYIWTEPRHVLKGLTPTCVNKNLEKFSSHCWGHGERHLCSVCSAQPTYALLEDARAVVKEGAWCRSGYW